MLKNAEIAGIATFALHKWKPIPYDEFVSQIHGNSTECADEHGHEGVRVTAYKLDRTTEAAIYYHPKNLDNRAVWTPFVMTLYDRRGRSKLIAFQYVDEAYDPHAPLVRDPEALIKN